MSQLGLKEQFRAGSISAVEALDRLEAMGASETNTARWFRRKRKAGDGQRDPARTETTRNRNLEANKPKEHNRKWRLGRGRFELAALNKESEETTEEE